MAFDRSVRRPTVRDVAAVAGVSKSLVSLVLRGGHQVRPEKRVAVEEAIRRLGYRPNAAARSLVERRTRSIGVIVADLANPHFVEVLAGFERICAASDYRLVFGNAHRRGDSAGGLVNTFLELRTDAIAIVGSIGGLRADDVRDLDCPLVIAAGDDLAVSTMDPPLKPVADLVRNDDQRGAAMAAEHLIALGHRRVGHLAGAPGAVALARQTGFLTATRTAGIIGTVEPADFTERAGYDATRRVLTSAAPPTAILACSDLAAIGALAAADDLGVSVPERLSIVGYDNTTVARIRRVSLTTVDPASDHIGETAARFLITRLNSRDPHTPREHAVDEEIPSRIQLIEPTLVIRDTTAPHP